MSSPDPSSQSAAHSTPIAKTSQLLYFHPDGCIVFDLETFTIGCRATGGVAGKGFAVVRINPDQLIELGLAIVDLGHSLNLQGLKPRAA